MSYLTERLKAEVALREEILHRKSLWQKADRDGSNCLDIDELQQVQRKNRYNVALPVVQATLYLLPWMARWKLTFSF